MDIFSFISLFGGLALFLYGMTVMSQGLEKLAGGKLEEILKKLTSNPVKSMLLGTGITAVIQSSSAVTVMLVGLVNSGIMQLGNTVGVIMGSNIGTTATAWILSTMQIEGEAMWIKLLKPESFSRILALIGVGMIMMSKSNRKKDIATIMIGFAVLMYGMDFMSASVEPLADDPAFTSILTAFSNPALGILAGLVLTAVIQSSSASVGILQAISLTGVVSYGMALPIIMGQNIGTCATALISSIGVNRSAKRVAVIHICFNVIGTLVCVAIFYPLNAFLDFAFVDQSTGPVGIALLHSIFNIINTALLLPFSKQLVKLAEKVIKDIPDEGEEELAFLDDLLLNTPSIALSECSRITIDMATIAKNSFDLSMEMLFKYNDTQAATIAKEEGLVDVYEDKLGSYLVKLSSRDLSDKDTRQISTLLHTIGDFERISDHALNIVKTSQEIHDKGIKFSPMAQEEIGVATEALHDILDMTTKAFASGDLELAGRVEPLEQVIDGLIENIKLNHTERLQTGDCTIEHGFVLSDLMNNYERVSDHCSNIAVAMIEISKNSFGTHEYLNKVKSMENPEFRKMYDEYEAKYTLKK